MEKNKLTSFVYTIHVKLVLNKFEVSHEPSYWHLIYLIYKCTFFLFGWNFHQSMKNHVQSEQLQLFLI